MQHRGQWTERNVSLLREHWIAGRSASQIAECLSGEFTRNAIIGKAHRMGLQTEFPRSQVSSTRAHIARRKRVLTPKKSAPVRYVRASEALSAIPVEALSPPEVTDIARVHFVNLEPNDCRWPIGEPTIGFCGCKRVAGLPYCEPHARRAFRAPEPKRGIADIATGRRPTGITRDWGPAVDHRTLETVDA